MNERLFLFFVHDKIKLFYFYFGIRTAFKPDQNGTCFYLFIFFNLLLKQNPKWNQNKPKQNRQKKRRNQTKLKPIIPNKTTQENKKKNEINKTKEQTKQNHNQQDNTSWWFSPGSLHTSFGS